MKRIYSKCACTALAAVSLTVPASAFLGFGDIVFDPSNYAQAVEQLLELQRQYQQMVATYQMVRSQYDHMVQMSRRVPVDMSIRYRARGTPWQRSQSSDTYGTNSAWTSAINSGVDVVGGYSRAVERLLDYGGSWSRVPTRHSGGVKTSFGTIELTDGSNRHSIETIGRLRASAAQVEAAIQALEDDSLSSRPDMNTEIAVLNKINAANVISLRSAQDTNKLLVALAESQVVGAKRTRDAEARALNAHIRFVNEGRTAIETQGSGSSDAMRRWRMP